MSTPNENGSNGTAKDPVHYWDPEAHKVVCGVPDQIGSTKHVRDVTCAACLDVLGKPSSAPVRLVPR